MLRNGKAVAMRISTLQTIKENKFTVHNRKLETLDGQRLYIKKIKINKRIGGLKAAYSYFRSILVRI